MKKIPIYLGLCLALILTACAAPAATTPSPLDAAAPSPLAPVSVTATPLGMPMATAAVLAEPLPTATPAPTQVGLNCTAPAETTPAFTEGPYYKSGSPERSSLLESGMPGTKLILSGYVLDTACKPVANAWLDFWQADSKGVYDNLGYTLRGHLYTDANGYYLLETVVPGLYPGRTEHIHVKAQAPNGSILTSQLFFPGVQSNDDDGIYDPRGLITIESSTAEQVDARYDFIIRTSE